MFNTVKISSCELINADCLEFIRSLPENSVDLIVTDPPYFKVKPEGWDNQWAGDEDYLKWLDQCLAQFWRVLKPAGSLYLFCGHRLASDTEIMMRERFNVLNHIIWAKPSGRWNGCNKESLRAYFPATERILFAEHYQGPYRPKDAGYEAKGRTLKQHVMAPLIAYFRDARAVLGITAKQIADATGKKNMVSHWFSAGQWQLPNESDYLKLQALFARVAEEKHQRGELEKPHHQLVDTYASLNRQYAELQSEYKHL
ncbi:site-specific DNA-methyltransferase, partial [Escherichia coli]|nr:site-specific DNA-methyltransferase [Escherichia coli]EEX0328749.1 site-specific DNA-methyltransferase [Escherichia coli]EEY7101659.1 site-specific DNA-methyltransferase [Escherichia coli]EEY7167228.1 site-specific DNA-methyltransferase [Escherichia coli]EFD9847403.1 site-specific DNA-methyltransferase [Escherichia coli]